MAASYNVIVKQIDEVLEKHQAIRSQSRYEDCSDQGGPVTSKPPTLPCTTIDRSAPTNNQYVQTMRAMLKRSSELNAPNIPNIVGILRALRAAYTSGYLATVTELIHADLFADFLEMADY